MKPPNKVAAAKVVQDQGSGGKKRACSKRDNPRGRENQLQTWDDVEQLTEELSWMAAWCGVLEWKLVSPHHHFDPAHLEAELNSYKRMSTELANSYRSTLRNGLRRAA